MKKIVAFASLVAVIGSATGVVFYLQKQRMQQAEPLATVSVASSEESLLDCRRVANPNRETPPQEPERKKLEAVDSVVEMGAANTEAALTSSEFIEALRRAVILGNVDAINAVLGKMPKFDECTELLERLVEEASSSAELRRYAIEALARMGCQQSVSFVLDQALAAYGSGDRDGTMNILASLAENPCGLEAAQELFSLLLGTGRYADYRENLSDEIRSAVRKALRNAQDLEGVGNLAASLYVDPQIIVRRDALLELFDGVSSPIMLARLGVQAYQGGRTEDADLFMDRLAKNEDQGAVQAFIQIGSVEATLTREAAERLCDWSRANRDQAQPGLFLPYLDSSRPSEERLVAAFGLAGCADKEEADRILREAIRGESDVNMRTNLQAALTTLHEFQP